MRILWLTIDRSHRVASHFDDFRATVESMSDVTVITKDPAGNKGQDAWQLSKRLVDGTVSTDNVLLKHLKTDSSYDCVFCDAFFAYLKEGWGKVRIPKFIFIEDIHGKVPRTQLLIARKLGIRNVFHRFNYSFHRFHPYARYNFKCFWLPHSVRMERFTDEVGKEIGILHVGVYPESYYPWRAHAVSALSGKPYFTRIIRPKDVPGSDRTKKWPIDKDYDNLLKSAKICVTGGSIFNAPVQKYIEIPAANSLLLSNWFPDLGLMGFVDERNMTVYDRFNLIEKVEDLLENEDKINSISQAGYNLILNNHTSEIRAKQFINNICDVIGICKEFPGIPPCSFQANFKSISIKEDDVKVCEVKGRSVKKGVVVGTDWRARIDDRN